MSQRSVATVGTASQRSTKRSRIVKKPTRTSRFQMTRGVGFPRSGIAEQARMTLRYVEQGLMSTTSQTTYTVYSCNGCYDPRTGIGGHQPYYFDQMMALYNHYHVQSSRAKFTVQDFTANVSGQLVGFVDDDATFGVTAADFPTNCERPDAVIKFTGERANKDFVPIYLKWNYTPTFGGSLLANNDLRGNSSSNPAEQSYYCIQVLNQGVVDSQYVLTVELEYDVIFTERKTIGGS